jgi:cytidylate kinase
MTKSKKIQVSMVMFNDVCTLLERLAGYKLDYQTQDCCKRIIWEIKDRIVAMEKRDTYTLSKVAPTVQEREEARQKYLDLAGIHKSFRYPEKITQEEEKCKSFDELRKAQRG